MSNNFSNKALRQIEQLKQSPEPHSFTKMEINVYDTTFLNHEKYSQNKECEWSR